MSYRHLSDEELLKECEHRLAKIPTGQTLFDELTSRFADLALLDRISYIEVDREESTLNLLGVVSLEDNDMHLENIDTITDGTIVFKRETRASCPMCDTKFKD